MTNEVLSGHAEFKPVTVRGSSAPMEPSGEAAGDKLECAFIRLRGATQRLLMVLESRSEHAYGVAIESQRNAATAYEKAKGEQT